jgi:hypothetical protein
MTYIDFVYNNEDTIYDTIDSNIFLEKLYNYYGTTDLDAMYLCIDTDFSDMELVKLLLAHLNISLRELIVCLSKIFDKLPSRKLKNTLARYDNA